MENNVGKFKFQSLFSNDNLKVHTLEIVTFVTKKISES